MRADILALSDDALADLTNKGTLRRARKEFDDPAIELSIAELADGTVEVSGNDEIRCRLLAERTFGDWECTCLAGRNCRHLVRAVIACRERAVQSADTVGETESVADFDPASITDGQLAAVLSSRARTAAAALIARGPVGLVGTANGLSVVRLHHPAPVTIRFLAGADLAYVRCTCTQPDPCLHLAVAVAVAKGVPFGDSGLRAVAGDDWRPDPTVLVEVRNLVRELVRVGVEASERGLRPRWERLSVRARAAELHHLADLVDLVLADCARYAGRDARFDPSRLVDLTGELLARAASLDSEAVDRIPDRLVAGSPAETTQVGRSRLIGMGTQLVELDDEVHLVAHLVDARSAAPLRITKVIADPQNRTGWSLARSTQNGIPFEQWGGGQVMLAGGRRFGQGDFNPGTRRVSGLPAAGLGELSPPFGMDSVAELASHQSRLPSALDDRGAGTDLAACRFASVEAVGFDASQSRLRARLADAAGGVAWIALTRTPRTAAGLGTVADLLLAWAEDQPPDGFRVAGRWRWTPEGPVVDPYLIAAGDQSVQPQIAPDSANPAPELAVAPSRRLTSPGALVREVDDLLGHTLVAGLDRLVGDPREWRESAARAQAAGSTQVAELARRVADRGDADAVLALLVWGIFARPLS